MSGVTKILLEGIVLSPVHIGSITWKNIEKKKKIVEEVEKEFLRIVGEKEYIKNYFKYLKEKVDKLSKFARDWREFIKDANDNFIIPGSSIKGSFSSCIEHYKGWKIDDIRRNIAFQNIVFRDVYIKKEDVIRANIFISKSKPPLENVEVIRPGTKFLLEMIYKNNPYLTLEELFVYPLLKNLKIFNLIIKKGEQKVLPKEVVEIYEKYVYKFGENFIPNDISAQFEFVKENSLLVRIGKYTGKLSKITLFEFENTYKDLQGSELRYVGRISENILMGIVKLKILSIIKS